MANVLPRIKWHGTTAQRMSITAEPGVMGYDTDLGMLCIFDGVTLGGHLIPSESVINKDFGLSNKIATMDDFVPIVIGLPDDTDFDDIRIGETIDGHIISNNQTYSVTITDSAASQTHPIKNDWNQSATWGNDTYLITCKGTSSTMRQTVESIVNMQKADRTYASSAWMSLTVGTISNIYWWVDDNIYASGLTVGSSIDVWYRKYKSGWSEQGGTFVTTFNNSRVAYTTITMPIAMQDTNYFVAAQGGFVPGTTATAYNVNNKTKTSFLVQSVAVDNTTNISGKANQGSWKVSGMAE